MARERPLSKVLISLLSVCYLCGSNAEGPLTGVRFSRLSAECDSQRLIKDTFLKVCDKDNQRDAAAWSQIFHLCAALNEISQPLKYDKWPKDQSSRNATKFFSCSSLKRCFINICTICFDALMGPIITLEYVYIGTCLKPLNSPPKWHMKSV